MYRVVSGASTPRSIPAARFRRSIPPFSAPAPPFYQGPVNLAAPTELSLNDLETSLLELGDLDIVCDWQALLKFDSEVDQCIEREPTDGPL